MAPIIGSIVRALHSLACHGVNRVTCILTGTRQEHVEISGSVIEIGLSFRAGWILVDETCWAGFRQTWVKIADVIEVTDTRPPMRVAPVPRLPWERAAVLSRYPAPELSRVAAE